MYDCVRAEVRQQVADHLPAAGADSAKSNQLDRRKPACDLDRAL